MVKKFEPAQLTLAESRKAGEYNLSNEQYCTLKSDLWAQIYDEAREGGRKYAVDEAKKLLRDEVRDEVRGALKPHVESELRSKLREEIKKELREPLLNELRADAMRAWEEERPSDAQRQAYADTAREFELHCATFAAAASREAEQKYRLDALRTFVCWAVVLTLLVGGGPFVAHLAGLYSHREPVFYLYLLPYLTLLGFAVAGLRVKSSYEKLRETAAQYMAYARKGARVRAIAKQSPSRGAIAGEVQGLYLPSELQEYCPKLRVVDEVRPEVRMRLAEEIDPEKIFAQEFDSKLNANAAKS